MAKRTPSPRVIAAKLLANVFEPCYFATTEHMGYVADTKVSDAKREKVILQLDKFTTQFRARIRKILDNFEKPPPRKNAK